MAKKKSYLEIKETVESQGSKLISDKYINSTSKLKMVCSCGEHFEKTYKVMNKSKFFICNNCINKVLNENKKIPFNEIVKRLEDKHMKIIVDEDGYKGIGFKYDFICEYGHNTSSFLGDVLDREIGCKECSNIEKGKRQRRDYNQIVELYESNNYKVITTKEEYNNQDKPNIIECSCNNGHVFNSIISNFINGARCMECYNENRSKWAIIPYEDRIKEFEKEGYKILTPKEQYIDSQHKIKVECNEGHIYSTTVHSFMNGYRCTMCNIKSKGERKIKQVLDKYNECYEREYRFEDCRGKKTYPFDYKIVNKNIVIEYDGIQHYIYGCFNMDLLDLMNRKYIDNKKTQYCKNNNIQLIRIPYWDFDNIEDILIRELKIKLK